jgi:neutral amino acid transport system permease protein
MHTGSQGSSRGSTLRSLLLLVVAGVLASLGCLMVAGSATAAPARSAPAAADGNTISGTLLNSAEGNAPVEGVEIKVTGPDGKEYTGTTDADGKFSVTVPGQGGQISVELVEDSLPDGVELRTGDNVRELTLLPNQAIPIQFPIGPDTRDVQTKWDRFPGLLYSGLLFGLIIAMASLGLNMVFGTTGLTNFAHGELVTFGALVAYMCNVWLHMPFVLGVVATVLLGMLFGWAQDAGLWRPLRRRGTGLIAMMIVTIGLQFFLRNMFQYFTEGRLLNYQEYLTPAGHDVGGLFTYTTRDIIIAVTSIVVLLVVMLGLSYTRLGRATRAVADNPALASATGINVDRVITVVWIVGTGLAALSGVFLGFQLGVTFQIGQLVLLLLFASCCVGGLGSIWGALVGSLIIGVLIDLSTLVIPSDLKNAGALLLLIVILLLRPQGLLGRKERIG